MMVNDKISILKISSDIITVNVSNGHALVTFSVTAFNQSVNNSVVRISLFPVNFF